MLGRKEISFIELKIEPGLLYDSPLLSFHTNSYFITFMWDDDMVGYLVRILLFRTKCGNPLVKKSSKTQ